MAIASLSRNPIRKVRTQLGKTLEEFSTLCGVHLQALYLNEQGVYPHILPAVARFIEEELELNVEEYQLDYLVFQRNKRAEFGALHDLTYYDVARLGEPDLSRHPVVLFRGSLQDDRSGKGISRMAFCKGLCIQPSLIYNLECGRAAHLGDQTVEALQQAGLPSTVIDELNTRSEEFRARHNLRVKAQ